MKKHATDDVSPVTHTLCGLGLPRPVDNAHPDCKRCLRAIAKRLRMEESRCG